MSIWQIIVLFALAGCALCCLLGIWRAIDKLAKGIFSVGTEMAKLNAKLQSIEAGNRDDFQKLIDPSELDTSFKDIEAAISNFERLKRVDLTKPIGRQGEPGDSGTSRQRESTPIFSQLSNRW